MSTLNPIAWKRDGDCMVVTSHKLTAYGYIDIRRNGRRTLLHRLVCERRHGRLGKFHALHSCDNTACINPDHLRPGTQQDNMTDKVIRGRSRLSPPPIVRYGEEKTNQAKLTNNDIALIRASTETQSILSAKFGVNQSVISRVKNNKAWRHIK